MVRSEHWSLSCHFFSFFFKLPYNVVLVSTVQYNDSATYIHIHPLFFGFPSHLGHHRALGTAPCAVQQVLISFLFSTQWCIYANPNHPIHPTLPGLPFLFLRKLHSKSTEKENIYALNPTSINTVMFGPFSFSLCEIFLPLSK